MRTTLAAVVLLGFVASALAQDPQESPPNKSEKIELPADQKVQPAEGFVTIAAKTTGEVRWLVVCSEHVKFLELDKAVVVSIPAVPTTVQIFAVALVDNKLTPFVRTVLTVEGARPPPAPNPGPAPNPNPIPTPGPAPGPAPAPLPAGARLHVTLILDYDTLTPATAALANSATLRKSLQDSNCVLRVYPATADVVKTRRLDQFLTRAGGPPVIIIQDDTGVVRTAEKLPADEAGVLAAVQKARGQP